MAINLFSGGNYINSIQAAGKNAVINGGMDIWQRGTSIAFAASANGYTADRWMTGAGTNATTTSRQATSDTTNLPFIQYCARVQRNSGETSTSSVAFVSSMESVNCIPLAGKTVTLSFYARKGANYSGGALTAYLVSGTGTDQNRLTGSYTGDNTSITSNFTLTTTWQRFTLTGTLPSTATELAPYFLYTPSGTAGAADYFEITGVQLELGSTATTFSRAGGTIQGELAACQRYYRKSYDTETAPGTATTNGAVTFYSPNTSSFPWFPTANFGINMRAVPTVTTYNPSTGSTTNPVRNITSSTNHPMFISQTGVNAISAYVDNSSITSGNVISYHYVASAEL